MLEEQKKQFCDEILENLNDFVAKIDAMKEYVFSAINEQTKNALS